VNVIEERIRAATRAAADTVAPDSVPPLELPAPRPRHLGRWLRAARSPGATWTPWAARLTPWAAALAVLAIVIVMVSVSHPARYGTSSGSSASVAAPPGVPAGPPASSYVTSGQVPRYYVQISSSSAVVHRTADGGTVGTIAPSRPGGAVVAVTADRDDRSFVLGEQDADRKTVAFYQFRLNSSGQPGPLTRLPMTVEAGATMTGLALSPDGTKLATALATKGGVQKVIVCPVNCTSIRTWSDTGGTIGAAFDTRSLSWTSNQRTLAFNWSVGQQQSVRLLNLDSSGGSLLAASRTAVTLGNTANMGQSLYQCGNLIITPDGSAIVCPSGTITILPKGKDIIYRSGFPEFSAATGRLVRIAGNWPVDRKQFEPSVSDLLWSDAAGRVLIGVIHSAGRYWVGVVSGNAFTPLNVRWDPAAPDFGAW